MTRLEYEGKQSLTKALNDINLDINKIILPDKCKKCEELRIIFGKGEYDYSYCPHCVKDVAEMYKEFNLDNDNTSDIDSIQEGEEPAGYPDCDYDDDSELGYHPRSEPWGHVR